MSRKCSKATKRAYGHTTPGAAGLHRPLRSFRPIGPTAPRTMQHIRRMRSHMQHVDEEAARLAPPARASAVGIVVIILVVVGRTAVVGWEATLVGSDLSRVEGHRG